MSSCSAAELLASHPIHFPGMSWKDQQNFHTDPCGLMPSEGVPNGSSGLMFKYHGVWSVKISGFSESNHSFTGSQLEVMTPAGVMGSAKTILISFSWEEETLWMYKELIPVLLWHGIKSRIDKLEKKTGTFSVFKYIYLMSPTQSDFLLLK